MKAISIKQPFAALIAAGVKRAETRTWATKYRGPLLIQASLLAHHLFCSYDHRTELLELDNRRARRKFYVPKLYIPRSGEMMCVVDLVDVYPFENTKEHESMACCDWYEGYIWKFENPRTTKPIPLKGKLSLFEVPDELIEYL